MARTETPSIPLSVLGATAARNLARHRRRTVVNVVSVAVTTGILTFFMGYYRGSYEELLYDTVIDYQTSHAQVQTATFDDASPDTYAKPANLMTDWQPLLAKVRGVDGVVEAAPRLMLAGYAGDGYERYPLLIAGVDPRAEMEVGVAERSIVAGSDLGEPGSILVGQALAKLFSLEPGSRCVLQTWTAYGAPNVVDFTVSGIYKTGFGPLDRNTVFIRLDEAQVLADTGDAINKVFVLCSDTRTAEAAITPIRQIAQAAGYAAQPWTKYAEALLDHTSSETYFYYVFLVILFALSVSTIANTMYVSVFERTREIGSIRAIGWRRGEVFRLFLFESAAVGLIGAAVGCVLGGLASFGLAVFPLDLRAMASELDVPFFEIKSTPALVDFVVAAAAGVVSAILAGITPARRATRVDIARALTAH